MKRVYGTEHNDSLGQTPQCVISHPSSGLLGRPTPPFAFVIPGKRPEKTFHINAVFSAKCKSLFEDGKNTSEIARTLNAPEHAVYNAMARHS